MYKPKPKFLCLLLVLLATPALLCAAPIRIKAVNSTIGKVMQSIEQQSGYTFFYKDNIVDKSRKVSIEMTDNDVLKVVDALFKSEGIKSHLVNKSIVLSKEAGAAVAKSAPLRTIAGIVRDENNRPLVGATCSVPGTSRGSMTNADGSYTIQAATGETIDFEYLGYEKVSIKLTDAQTKVDVRLAQNSTVAINDVVVTALGITRQEKSLGYAVSKLDNEQLTTTESGNWLNGLSGKVAGLNLDTSAASPAGSVRVTLRGESSLSHDNNTALFVVDGIPINSSMDANSNASSYESDDAPIDYGNDSGSLNPDDIESVSVLKGPAATALYGSRAANGAIVITTKSGKKNRGLGIIFSSSVVLEKAGFWPDFQNEYGPGNIGPTSMKDGHMSNGISPDEYSFWSVTADKTDTGQTVRRYHSRYHYGERIEGQMRYLYSSRNWDDDTYTREPYRIKDWYKGFFRTGVTYTNSLSVDAGDGKGQSMRVSVKDSRNEWIVPNTGYNTQNISFSASSNKNKYISAQAKVTYVRKNSDNLPIAGYSNATPLKSLMWNNGAVSVKDHYNSYKSGREQLYHEGSSDGYVIDGTMDNPYAIAYEHLNTQSRDRVYGNVSLTGSIIPNVLTVMLRSGLDFSNDFRTQQKPHYTMTYSQGMYSEQTVRKLEVNTDFLITYKKDFTNGLSLNVSFGGNNMVYKYNNILLKANMLDVPNVYMLSNAKGSLLTKSVRRAKSINSFYGFATIGYRDMFYIDITGRNDWSSTLPKNNNSYFYPSVSASVLLSEIFHLNEKTSWINLLKVRGSWANVGNDTDPYQLIDAYTINGSFTSSYELASSLKNPNLKPENVESWEVGLEAKLFKGIWSFDVAYYDSNTTNQIITVPTDWITGASTHVINAGKVRNNGIEISTEIKPIRRNKDWKLNISLNWSKNWNKLVELAPGVDVWQLNKNTIGSRVLIYAYPGTELGRIYGVGYERAPQGAFYYDADGKKVDCSGKVIVDSETGNPVIGEKLKDLGGIYPDWKAGMTLSLKWKGLGISTSFAASVGGKAYSLTNAIFSYMGKNTNSLEGRYEGLIHDGVNLNADGTYRKNTTVTTDIVDYYATHVWHRNNVEQNTFDTSYLKMKELRISYDLPKKVCAASRVFTGVTFAFFMTNVFCITNFPQFDPEVASLAGSSLYRGVETGSYPMTRTYGFNIKLKF